MPDISKIKLPDETVSDIKDEEVRNVLDILLGREESEDDSE